MDGTRARSVSQVSVVDRAMKQHRQQIKHRSPTTKRSQQPRLRDHLVGASGKKSDARSSHPRAAAGLGCARSASVSPTVLRGSLTKRNDEQKPHPWLCIGHADKKDPDTQTFCTACTRRTGRPVTSPR
ncbi:uncharacterized protein PV09_04263 [Verruconis gallopava]|uniref:Uncharacterized protein n=1 Tax=Verruconis gallopava TaxID=253628 RepID=A0A0D1YV56_9PEZI|nr:uncharacterized protein PV09_04263 [Verruconis gallopava]KIW04507.1 hypothetical protein PV09_04263 [Verruconis gallopava]